MLDDDFDYEFPDDPDPWMFDEEDTWDEGEPTLRMLAQAFNIDDEDKAA